MVDSTTQRKFDRLRFFVMMRDNLKERLPRMREGSKNKKKALDQLQYIENTIYIMVLHQSGRVRH